MLEYLNLSLCHKITTEDVQITIKNNPGMINTLFISSHRDPKKCLAVTMLSQLLYTVFYIILL
jgi:hypothetical protein